MIRIIISLVVIMLPGLLSAQQEEWKMYTRHSFYTHEELGEVLLHVPDAESGKRVELVLSANGGRIHQADTVLPQGMMRIPLPLSRIRDGQSRLVLWVNTPDSNQELVSTVYKLIDKPNQVKVDRLEGYVIAGGRPYFPYGFYCYSPVQPTLAEEEVVKGFNMMSPYQKIEEATLDERIAYMDRCAELGMKVHYNLLSVASGGGVGSSRADARQSERQRKNRLIREVNYFKDHPALLAWYISDEPTGHGATPESVKADYELIKSIDPWHPITVVFMAPMRAREYADGLDIVMADPYPIPNGPVSSVGTTIHNLNQEFMTEKPVWVVPQAFGGGEHWLREPSLRELRAMTWLSIVEGASGVQFFIRHGRNGFPKSTATWDECARIGMEIRALQPFLLTGQDIGGFMSENENIKLLVKESKGDLLIVAVNQANEPAGLAIKAPFSLSGSEIEVLYENRSLSPEQRIITDYIDGMGTRIYRLTGFEQPSHLHPGNLIRDPGFEDETNPGVPASCYARVGKDRGSSYFQDPVMPFEGRYSLRMTTPDDGMGNGLSFFPLRLESGLGYTLSLWARLDTNSILIRERSFFQKLFGLNKYEGSFFNVSAGTFAENEFKLTGEWDYYTLHFNVPEDGNQTIQVNPYLELATQGTAWFDRLELYADPVIDFGINSENRQFEVSASTTDPRATIYFTLDGRIPDTLDGELKHPVMLDQTTVFTAATYKDGELVNYSVKPFYIHQAVGKKPIYEEDYNSKYTAGGDFGLVDGIRGSRDYMDGRWQGFMRRDLDVVIDLDQTKPMRQVTVGCLQDTRSWIFMPVKIEFWGSVDGRDFKPLGRIDNTVDPKASGAIKKDYTLQFGLSSYRYLRVKASNLGLCPDWHNGRGAAAFMFIDEIIVE